MLINLLHFLLKYFTFSLVRLFLFLLVGVILYVLFWYIPEKLPEFTTELSDRLSKLENVKEENIWILTKSSAFHMLLIPFFKPAKYLEQNRDTTTLIFVFMIVFMFAPMLIGDGACSLVIELQLSFIYDNYFFILFAKSTMAAFILIGHVIMIDMIVSVVFPAESLKGNR